MIFNILSGKRVPINCCCMVVQEGRIIRHSTYTQDSPSACYREPWRAVDEVQNKSGRLGKEVR